MLAAMSVATDNTFMEICDLMRKWETFSKEHRLGAETVASHTVPDITQSALDGVDQMSMVSELFAHETIVVSEPPIDTMVYL